MSTISEKFIISVNSFICYILNKYFLPYMYLSLQREISSRILFYLNKTVVIIIPNIFCLKNTQPWLQMSKFGETLCIYGLAYPRSCALVGVTMYIEWIHDRFEDTSDRSVITSNFTGQVSLLTKQGLVITSPICRTFVDEATVGRDVKDEIARVKRGLRGRSRLSGNNASQTRTWVCIIFALIDDQALSTLRYSTTRCTQRPRISRYQRTN